MRTATSRPSRAPATIDSYTRTREATPTSSRPSTSSGASQPLSIATDASLKERLREASRQLQRGAGGEQRERAPHEHALRRLHRHGLGQRRQRGRLGGLLRASPRRACRAAGARRSAGGAAASRPRRPPPAWRSCVAIRVGTQIASGALEPAAARTADRAGRRHQRDAGRVDREEQDHRVAWRRPGTRFRRFSSTIAFSPKGVAALPSPSMFDARFITIAPIAG